MGIRIILLMQCHIYAATKTKSDSESKPVSTNHKGAGSRYYHGSMHHICVRLLLVCGTTVTYTTYAQHTLEKP